MSSLFSSEHQYAATRELDFLKGLNAREYGLCLALINNSNDFYHLTLINMEPNNVGAIEFFCVLHRLVFSFLQRMRSASFTTRHSKTIAMGHFKVIGLINPMVELLFIRILLSPPIRTTADKTTNKNSYEFQH